MAAKSSWLIIDYTMDQRVLGYLIALRSERDCCSGWRRRCGSRTLDVNAALKDGGRGATGGRNGRHLSALLVTGEMALAVVLLAGAGVMIRSYLKIHSADMGVDITNILGGSVDLPAARYPRPEDRISFYDRLTARLQAMPGVESVATADTLPSWGSSKIPYELAGAPSPDDVRRPKLSTLTISPSYFRTLRAPLLVRPRVQRCRCRVRSAGGDRESIVREQVLAGRRSRRQASSLLRGKHDRNRG